MSINRVSMRIDGYECFTIIAGRDRLGRIVPPPVVDRRRFITICQRHTGQECVYRQPSGPSDEGCAHVELGMEDGVAFRLCKRPI